MKWLASASIKNRLIAIITMATAVTVALGFTLVITKDVVRAKT